MNVLEMAKSAGITGYNSDIEFFVSLVRAEREWVDLTCEEVTAQIREGAADGGWQGFATRIQNAFKEKNK